MSQALPELAQRYVERVLGNASSAPERVQITQTGEMWQKPGARALRFTAEQWLAVGRIAFEWRARFPIAPLLWLEVVDGYDGDRGRLEGRLWGKLRVMRRHGPEVDRGQAMRYLSELPWVPYAIAGNAALRLREIADDRLEVSAVVHGARAAVNLDFDAGGDVIGMRADARPYMPGVEHAWGGRFWAHAEVGGVRIPTRAEAWWELPEGRFTYWRGHITALAIA